MTRRALHPAMAIVGLAAAAHAQQASPAFEVASVKRNLAGDPRVGGPTALGRNTPNGVSYTNYTLPMLIRTAYGIREDWISGGPEWVRTARFDVVARAGSEVSRDELYTMLRTLLGERFKLTVSRQQRERDAYVLRLNRADGRLGPDLRKALDDCESKRPSDPLEQVRQLPRPSSGALPTSMASCMAMESVVTAFERTLSATIIDSDGPDRKVGFRHLARRARIGNDEGTKRRPGGAAVDICRRAGATRPEAGMPPGARDLRSACDRFSRAADARLTST